MHILFRVNQGQVCMDQRQNSLAQLSLCVRYPIDLRELRLKSPRKLFGVSQAQLKLALHRFESRALS